MKLAKFAALSLPSLVIAAMTWCWIVGLIPECPFPEEKGFAAACFVTANYFAAGMMTFGP